MGWFLIWLIGWHDLAHSLRRYMNPADVGWTYLETKWPLETFSCYGSKVMHVKRGARLKDSLLDDKQEHLWHKVDDIKVEKKQKGWRMLHRKDIIVYLLVWMRIRVQKNFVCHLHIWECCCRSTLWAPLGNYVSVGAMWSQKGGWTEMRRGRIWKMCLHKTPGGVNILVFSQSLWWWTNDLRSRTIMFFMGL